MKRRRRSPVRHWAALLGAGACLACQTPNYVPDAQGAKSISIASLSCSKPYELSQDCSTWDGASREIEIGDFRMKVAGSADGRVVLLMGPSPIGDSARQTHGDVTNFAYEDVKRELAGAGIAIVKVEPVASLGQLMGYAVHADGDAYAVLKAHSVVGA